VFCNAEEMAANPRTGLLPDLVRGILRGTFSLFSMCSLVALAYSDLPFR
jgi:hypothetical protein